MAVAAAIGFGAIGAASAATVTFGGYVTTTDNLGVFPTPSVIVDDDTAGLLSFSISTSGESGNLAGAFFDVSGKTVGLADILNESVAIAGFGNNTGNVGGGVVMNGTYTNGTNNPTFDFGLRIAQTDVSSTPFTFQISTAILSLSDLERVGLRFQTVSGSGVTNDSAKVLGYPEVGVIPLPASGLLLLAGFGGLAVMRRLRKD